MLWRLKNCSVVIVCFFIEEKRKWNMISLNATYMLQSILSESHTKLFNMVDDECLWNCLLWEIGWQKPWWASAKFALFHHLIPNSVRSCLCAMLLFLRHFLCRENLNHLLLCCIWCILQTQPQNWIGTPLVQCWPKETLQLLFMK